MQLFRTPGSREEPQSLRSSPVDGSFVPEEFREAIVVHISKNFMRNMKPTLILAIQGPPGEGKSFQVREVCSEMGVALISLSGSTLSGPYEGEAIRPLAKAYIQASELRRQHNRMAALLIDDFDVSVASRFDRTENTVNTQLLSGFLMNLADDPNQCGDQETSRIPIILTGNDFSALHGPLRRHGRISFFDWVPSKEQRELVVRSIFRDILLERDGVELRRLVERYKLQPISFFSALKEDLAESVILETVKRDGRVNVESLERAFEQQSGRVTLDKLFSLAEKRSKTGPSRFLRRDEPWA